MAFKRIFKYLLSLIFIILTVLLFMSGPYKPADGQTQYLIGSARVQLTGGTFATKSKHLTAIISEEDVPLLRYFTRLESADFSGSLCHDAIIEWSQENPDVHVRYTLPLPNGQILESDAVNLDLSWMTTEEIPMVLDALSHLVYLENIELGVVGTERLELGALADMTKALPNVNFGFSVSIDGMELSPDVENIDLSSITNEKAADYAVVLSMMKNLKTVELGSQSENGLEWKNIALLKASCPSAKFSYSFTLYGQEHTLDSEKMDFRGVSVDDNGEALYSVLACMNNCKYLDMDSTGVEDEVLANLRELFPQTEIHWRIWFGENYSVRTDTERVLASKPTVGGMIYDPSPLQYCTKMKYLDLGHNDEMYDISFVANMPDLEVLIIAMTGVTDISALKNLTKLDYLELNSGSVSDLSPLAGCTNLKHLNIACCPNITDISPLFGLTGMERLWIGNETPVPYAQVSEMKKAAPACKINTTTSDPHGESWRFSGYDPEIPLYYWVPRHEQLREELGYNYQEYSFYWLDPLCDLEAPPEHAGKYGKEVYGL